MPCKTKEKRLEWQKNYYKTHPEQYEKLKAKMRLRKKPYERFKKDRCERCGQSMPEHNSKWELCVHHSDRDRTNDNPTNLITLCRSCHRKEHAGDMHNLFYKGKGELKFDDKIN